MDRTSSLTEGPILKKLMIFALPMIAGNMLAPNTPLGVNAIWWSIPIGWILADLVGAAKMWRDSRRKQL